MVKAEFLEAVANACNEPKARVDRVLSAAVDVIREQVAKGEPVGLAGLGSFHRHERNAREARNPRNGEMVKVSAAHLPRFKAAKAFKDAMPPVKKSTSKK